MVTRLILIADGKVQVDGPANELWDGNKRKHDFATGH